MAEEYRTDMTSLSDSQKDAVRRWIESGLKLAEIQKRLASEMGQTLTYMEARFLVDDLKLVPKDPEPPAEMAKPEATSKSNPGEAVLGDEAPEAPPGPPSGGVTVTADAIARPGAMASGRVKFSDGQGGAWLVDQYGRPGFVPDTKGYRPSPGDMQQFQMGLERELMRLGM